MELPEGFKFKVVNKDHPIIKDISWENADFPLLGYK